MSSNPINLICLVLVFFFGSVSCTSDKEVVYRADSFKPEGLKVQNDDKSYVNAEDIKELKPGGALTIESLADNNFTENPISLKIESECRQGGKGPAKYNEGIFHNTASVDVLKILPEDLLLSLSTEIPRCDFVITITNSFSSKSTIELKSIKILGLAEYKNMELPFVEHDKDGGQRVVSYDAVRDVVISTQESGKMYFHCDEIDETWDLEKIDFTLGGLFVDRAEALENVTRTLQTCRILLSETETPRLSPVFKLQLPIRAPDIAASVVFNGKNHVLSNPNVLSLRLFNPQKYPVTVKLADIDQARFVFKAAYFHGVGNLSNAHAMPLVWNISTAASETTPQFIKINIQPGETVTAAVSASGNMSCSTQYSTYVGAKAVGKFTSRLYSGMNFDFILPKARVVAEDGTETDFDINILKTPIETPSELKYWDIYVYDYGKIFITPQLPIGSNDEAIKFISWGEILEDCRAF